MTLARVFLLTFLSLGTSQVAHATYSQITSVNGIAKPAAVYVYPGQELILEADTYLNGDRCREPQTRFRWRAQNEYYQGPECDPNFAYGCSQFTNFSVGPTGRVSYWVPLDAPERSVIKVRKWNSFHYDELVLINLYANREFEVYSDEPVFHPGERETFDYVRFLSQFGLFIEVHGLPGVKFFKPFPALAGTNWVPLKNGYYAWSEADRDNIWVSYEPWGAVTSHYGVWRNHRRQGWIFIWDGIYRPNRVTFIYEGDTIAWCPYFPNYDYKYGYAEGFRDGFWTGLRHRDFGLYFQWSGFVFIGRSDFYSRRVKRYRQRYSFGWVQSCFSGRRMGRFPYSDRFAKARDARGFWERETRLQAYQVKVKNYGKYRFAERPKVEDSPDRYRSLIEKTRSQRLSQRERARERELTPRSRSPRGRQILERPVQERRRPKVERPERPRVERIEWPRIEQRRFPQRSRAERGATERSRVEQRSKVERASRELRGSPVRDRGSVIRPRGNDRRTVRPGRSQTRPQARDARSRSEVKRADRSQRPKRARKKKDS